MRSNPAKPKSCVDEGRSIIDILIDILVPKDPQFWTPGLFFPLPPFRDDD